MSTFYFTFIKGIMQIEQMKVIIWQGLQYINILSNAVVNESEFTNKVINTLHVLCARDIQ